MKNNLRIVTLAAILISVCLLETFGQGGAPSILNINGTVCAGDNAQFRATTSCTISQWTASSGGVIQGSSNQPVVFVIWSTASTNAWIQVTYSNCTTSFLPLTINSKVTPSVSIGLSSNTICQPQNITLQATPVNVNGSPNYAWYIDSQWVANTTTTSYTYSASSLLPGAHTASVTISAMSCSNLSTVSPISPASFTVSPNVGSVSIQSGATSRCIGTGTDTYTASASNATSYTWSINQGGTISPAGVVTWGGGFSGTARITVVANGCNGSTSAPAFRDVIVTPVTGPVTALTGTTIRCIGATSDTYTPTVTNPTSSPGYTFTLYPQAAGNISPAGGTVNWSSTFSGLATVSVVAISCNGSTSPSFSTNINVTPLVGPVSNPSGGSTSRCIGVGTDTYTATASNATSYTWSIDQGGTISTAGVVTWNSSFTGTARITVVANGCNGSTSSPASTNVMVTPLVGSVSIQSGATSRCIGTGTDTYTASASSATSYTWSINQGGTISPAGVVTWGGGFSGTARITVVANGCNGSVSSPSFRDVVVTPLTGPVTALTGITIRCIGATSDTYTPTVTNPTSSPGYTFTLSPPAAGNISPAGGTVNWSSTFSGLATVSVVAISCNGSTTPSFSTNINVTPLVGPVSNPSGGSTSRCIGVGTDTYTATASNATSYTWSIDQGGTISTAGVVTWNSSFSGTARITVVANGCNGSTSSPAYATVTVNSLAAPPMPVNGNITTECGSIIPISVSTSYLPGYTISHHYYDGNGVFLVTMPTTSPTSGVYVSEYTPPTFASPKNFQIEAEVAATGSCPAVKSPRKTITYTLNSPPPAPSSLVVNQGPTSISSINVCAGESISLTASNGTSNYLWYQGGNLIGSSSSLANYTPTSGGTHTVTATWTSPCGGNVVIQKTFEVVLANPTASMSNPGDSFCTGDTPTFSMTSLGATNVTYQWTLSNGGASGSSSSYTLASTLPANTYTLSCIVTADFAGQCQGRKIFPAVQRTFIIKQSPGLPAVYGSTQFGNGTIELIAAEVFPVPAEYRWYKTGQPTYVGNAYPSFQISQTTANYIAVSAVGTNSCEGPRRNVDITILPLPTISYIGTDYIPIGGATTITTSTYDSYLWKNSVNVPVGSTQTLQVTQPDTYSLTVTKTGATGNAQIKVGSNLSNQNLNFVSETTVQIGGVLVEQNLASLVIGQKLENVQYFDGLGRPIQTVASQGSPNKSDLVQPSIYDTYGREYRKFLPVSLEANGRFKTGLLSGGNYTNNFYNNATDKIADDASPFSEIVYEPSPLNRVIEQGAPGSAWQPGTGHTVTKKYEVNMLSEVYLFKYDAATGLVSLPMIEADKYYLPNQLYANKTFDEQGNEMIEYTDKQGRTVCKKVYVETISTVKQYACTYYVYDDFGNLVVVLPPEAIKSVLTAFTQN
jgi:hypothetical protein